MATLNLTEAGKLLGFRSPSTLRRLYQSGVLDAYLRSGPDRRATYLETDPKDRASLREWVRANVQFHPASPIWRREPLPETMSDEAVAEIDRWIEGRADWTVRANEFLDPAAWSGPPWSRDQWQTLRVIIDMALDDD